MKRQQGFTLIELIIVIVVLGILAVTAAPQFINFSSDARESTVKGAQASIQGAMQLVYARSLVNGTEDAATSTVTTEGGVVDTVYGYPAAAVNGIDRAAGLGSDWSRYDSGTSPATNSASEVAFAPTGQTPDFTGADSCHVLYTEAADEDTPATVVVNVAGC
ncbi:type II secretion system protein [Pseudidiomarina terrestris]|uniref:Prepilin-type N-terminal cleavage/methylation domain-containing protein n=1 Tax=Pseudidiomarina terrestris TaxID=2820060 RepID=A0ABT8MHM8_9GAMM|nr:MULTISPECIES: prepilin-type N-terminal cleavage/methylation domain-containing protein [unclassified Pseudidiomarina]MDN7129435.1 prepilin-type N-terminal cleavage/methylation domain-containing protein [Pseudidiomarina sp. 1APR75-15]MDN7134300.1 prepilin-type N-terminal cleavage/methylation domain-containing protein [Pseudidiomarina sp. 1ASP75-5]